MDTSSDSLSPVELLAEEFLDRQQRGETPTIEEYCQRNPELADEIRDVFEGFLLIENLKPGSNDISETFSGERQLDGKKLDRVGDYRIIREVGRGGMGVVYEAEQESLSRRVALKVLSRHAAGDEKSLLRFQREARAAARMHHTNIVPVFEVGDAEQHVFYAMQLIQGQSLDLVIDDLRRLRTEHLKLRDGKGLAEIDSIGGGSEQKNLAASLVTGRFHQEKLLDQDGQNSESIQCNLALALDEEAHAETVLTQSGSTQSAVLPGQSELVSVESNQTAYFQSVAEIGLQVGQALAYAHARGIVHRDIKPSNLILDAAGVVWVTDFGLAKTSEEAMTHTGDILGTIRYMSPERFKGQCDVRSDVYALGLTLYELVTLRPAFSSPDRLRLIELVTNEEPPLPRSLDPKVPRDLETIILKCADKDARRRYQSADELCEDLERLINDEPIKARRLSLSERFARWSRRNKSLAIAFSVIACLMTVSLIGSAVAARYFHNLQQATADERDKAKVARQEAIDSKNNAELKEQQTIKALKALKNEQLAREQAENERAHATNNLRRSLYHARIHMARVAAANGDLRDMQILLDQAKKHDLQQDYRSFEWYYLRSQTDDPHRVLRGLQGQIHAVAWHPDGRRVAAGSRNDNVIRVWDANTGELIRTMSNPDKGVWGLDWSPDGKRLATANMDMAVRIFDAISGQELLTLMGHASPVLDVSWSPDGKQLASVAFDGAAHLWDADNGQLLKTLPHENPQIWCVAWHPDGDKLATGHYQHPLISIWDTTHGKRIQTLKGHGTSCFSLAWHADGKRLASGGDNGEVLLWTLGNSKPTIIQHETTDWVHKVAWNPRDPNQLLTVSGDKSASIWDFRGKLIRRFFGHTDWIQSGSWSPDGTRVATGSADQTVRIWNAVKSGASQSIKHHEKSVRCLSWSPEVWLLATGDDDGLVTIWDARTQEPVKSLPTDKQTFGKTASLAFSPEGDFLAAGGSNGLLLLWNVETWEVRSIQTGSQRITAIAWHPQRPEIATGSHAQKINFWEPQTGEFLDDIKQNFGTRDMVYSPDGKFLLSAGGNKQPVHLWDASTKEKIGEISPLGFSVNSLCFSPDGLKLAVGSGLDAISLSHRGLIRIWNWESLSREWSRAPEMELEVQGNVQYLTWTADGQRLASSVKNGPVLLWDVSAKPGNDMSRELLRFQQSGSANSVIRFSPEGTQLVQTSGKNVIWHNAESAYRAEGSLRLLTVVDERIQSGTASSTDYKVKGEALVREGDWPAAAAAYKMYYELDGEDPWVPAGVWVAGHYSGDFSKRFAPEQELKTTGPDPFETLRSKTGEPQRWIRVDRELGEKINFGNVLGDRENATAYALYRVYSPKDQMVGILLGDDDYHRLWVNGEIVSENASISGANPNEHACSAKLKAGWNTLLVKVVNKFQGHELILRLSDDPLELADTFERKGNFAEAEAMWNQAIQNHPEDKLLLLKRGMTRWLLGNQKGSEEDFQAFIQGREKDPLALEQRAKAYLQVERHEQGDREYEKAVQADPALTSIRWRRVREGLARGELETVEPHLSFLVTNAPDDFMANYFLAYVRLGMGDERGFRELRQEILDRWGNTSNPAIGFITAEVLLTLPPESEELPIAVRLVNLIDDSHPVVYQSRVNLVHALALYRQGRQAEIERDLKSAKAHFRQAQEILEHEISSGLFHFNQKTNRTRMRYLLASTLWHLGEIVDVSDPLIQAEKDFPTLAASDDALPVIILRALREELREEFLGAASGPLAEAESLVANEQFENLPEVLSSALAAMPDSPLVQKCIQDLLRKTNDGNVTLLPTAEHGLVDWHYRFQVPSESWKTGDDVDNGWTIGPAPFGSDSHAKTLWPGRNELWLRREFQLEDLSRFGLIVRGLIDDNAEIYLNGRLIASRKGWTQGSYVEIDCDPAANLCLQTGRNVLAVHATNGYGAAALDVGLYASNLELWQTVLDKAIEKNAEALSLIRLRATERIRDGKYRLAAEDHVRFTPIAKDLNHPLNTATLFALGSDKKAYHDYCRQLNANLTDMTRLGEAAKVVKSCVILPAGIDPERLPISALDDAIANLENPGIGIWHRGTRALAAYRAGDLEAAQYWVDQTQQHMQQNDNSNHGVLTVILPLQAMLAIHAHHTDKAETLLDQCLDVIESKNVMRHADGSLAGASLLNKNGLDHNTIICELLRREAEQLLETEREQKSAAAKPTQN